MRIISWNVNGLRAAISKGAIDELLQLKADVLCLQEIKAKPEQLNEQQIDKLGEYEPIWNPAERPGYSGVATFTRKPPDLIEISMGEERFDIEGRFIRADYGE